MEHWSDQAIVLGARPHGEGGAVASLLTAHHGRHAGYVHGGMSSKKRAVIEPGQQVQAEWQSRLSDNLGTYNLESEKSISLNILEDRLKLQSLLSACALCDAALPEREGHPGLYHGLKTLIEILGEQSPHLNPPPLEGGRRTAEQAGGGMVWAFAYIMWEIQLLRELGFHLELDKCAGGGDVQTLTHVSPKTGRAVSAEKAAPYKDKLLPMPDFLRPTDAREGHDEATDIALGFAMTGYFLEHWAFVHHTQGLPQARLLLGERMKKAEDF